jgi:hypothetical protein
MLEILIATSNLTVVATPTLHHVFTLRREYIQVFRHVIDYQIRDMPCLQTTESLLPCVVVHIREVDAGLLGNLFSIFFGNRLDGVADKFSDDMTVHQADFSVFVSVRLQSLMWVTWIALGAVYDAPKGCGNVWRRFSKLDGFPASDDFIAPFRANANHDRSH